MSIKVTTYVWEQSKHNGSELLMLLALAFYANDAGVAWPSLSSLAKKCRVLKRQAIRTIQNLERDGIISIARGNGRGHPSVYTLKGVTDDTVYQTKGVTDDTVYQTKGVTDDTVYQTKGVTDDTVTMEERVSPTTPITDTKGVIQGTKGVIQGTVRDPSLDPSEEKPKTLVRLTTKHGKPLAPEYSPGYLAFWDCYPHERRVSKPTCFQVWQRQALEVRTAEICEKVERLKATSWRGKEPTYIPNTTTWLNQGRYDDDLMPMPRAVIGGGRLSDREQRTAQASLRMLEEMQRGDPRSARVSRRLE